MYNIYNFVIVEITHLVFSCISYFTGMLLGRVQFKYHNLLLMVICLLYGLAMGMMPFCTDFWMYGLCMALKGLSDAVLDLSKYTPCQRVILLLCVFSEDTIATSYARFHKYVQRSKLYTAHA